MAKVKMIAKHTQSKEEKERQRKREIFRTGKWDQGLQFLEQEVKKKQEQYLADLEKEKKEKEEELVKQKAERAKKDEEKKAAKEAARAAQTPKAEEKQA